MVDRHTRLPIAIIFVACVSANTIALTQSQSKPTDQDEPVRLRTELVQVQVVVTDKQGRVIEGLKKDDFELLEQGRRQEVSFFSLERVGVQPTRPRVPGEEPVPTHPPTRVAEAATPSRSIVLFFDTLHLSGPSLIRSKLSMKQYLDGHVTDRDTVVVAASSGVFGIFQNPARNRLAVHRLIERINDFDTSRQSNFTPYLAAMVKQGDRTAFDLAVQILAEELRIDAVFAAAMVRGRAGEVLEIASYKRQSTLSVLTAVVEGVTGMSGQRLLILLSDGFTMRDFNGAPDTGRVQSAISKAVRAGVIIYSIDVKGLEVGAEFDASRRGVSGGSLMIARLSSYMSASAKDRQDGINALAQDTGGKFFFNTNDLKGAVQKAVDLNQAYYALAYYPPDDKGTKEFRRITVRVKSHPEYDVRTQKGYFASDLKRRKDKELAQSPQQRLFTEIAKPLPASDIGVSASADYLEVGTDVEQVSLQALIDGTDLNYREQNGRLLLELEMAAVVYDRTGKPIKTLTETIRGSLSPQEADEAKRTGFHYSKRIALKPGLYNVRLGLREVGTDRIGAATTWLEVPNLDSGKLTLSSILLTKDSAETSKSPGSKAARTALGTASYRAGSPILYYLLIYNALGESDLRMQWEIAEAGKVIHMTEWQPVTSRVIGRYKRGIEIGGQLALTLQPGVYELRITVSDSKSRQTANRTVAFAIEG
ncbi:MAG: VWA domain-containing protein [Blastocatellia bacterium]